MAWLQRAGSHTMCKCPPSFCFSLVCRCICCAQRQEWSRMPSAFPVPSTPAMVSLQAVYCVMLTISAVTPHAGCSDRFDVLCFREHRMWEQMYLLFLRHQRLQRRVHERSVTSCSQLVQSPLERRFSQLGRVLFQKRYVDACGCMCFPAPSTPAMVSPVDVFRCSV